MEVLSYQKNNACNVGEKRNPTFVKLFSRLRHPSELQHFDKFFYAPQES